MAEGFLVVFVGFFFKMEAEMCFSLYRCHLRLNHINESYDSIITQNEDRSLFNEIFCKIHLFSWNGH